eukprot:TRINITY_DN11153_c0_g1_i4.p1 TRINITY_DN11153_c0_g1~~TRINITY_DN11153_c0_g1_i4.p1  ORF type:complete len:1572 (-),score=211.38 TRINITY_DN11153_c0_g1_i4:885-5600(-)
MQCSASREGHATGGDAAGGVSLEVTDSLLHVRSTGLPDGGEARKDLLNHALQEIEHLTARASFANEERRRCLETSRRLRGTIRIMGRVRPTIEDDGEDSNSGCLRVINRQQLEVLTEPRALLTEQSLRHRRRTTGGIHEVGRPSSKSAGDVVAASTVPGASAAAAAGGLGGAAQGASVGAMSSSALDTRTFFFDDLFDATATDDDLFAAVRDEVGAAVDGEAVCILAYGSTGSGKTHTVTNMSLRASRELERQAIALQGGGVCMEITVQIVEIYNEQLRDLLTGEGCGVSGVGGAGGGCAIAAEPPRLKLSGSLSSPTLQGASSRVITAETGRGIAASLEEALRLGQAQRATSATAVHGRSSRSHLVMTLFLALRDALSGAVQRTGKLSLVDLAGSERLKRSEAAGERLREAQHINRSLSALADVMSAKERRGTHVPYRNSKLTHLLQDALGGVQQSRTVVIVALPPTRESLNDTLHSLQFSSRLTALTLPSVVSRRSLGGGGPEGAGTGAGVGTKPPRVSGWTAAEEGGGSSSDLKQEIEVLRSGLKEARKELERCKSMLCRKDMELEEVTKQMADIRARDDLMERNRDFLFHGLAGINRRLREVEAVAVEESCDGIASSDALSTSASRRSSVTDGLLPPAAQTMEDGGARCLTGTGRTTTRSVTTLPRKIKPVLRGSRSTGSSEPSSASSRPLTTVGVAASAAAAAAIASLPPGRQSPPLSSAGHDDVDGAASISLSANRVSPSLRSGVDSQGSTAFPWRRGGSPWRSARGDRNAQREGSSGIVTNRATTSVSPLKKSVNSQSPPRVIKPTEIVSSGSGISKSARAVVGSSVHGAGTGDNLRTGNPDPLVGAVSCTLRSGESQPSPLMHVSEGEGCMRGRLPTTHSLATSSSAGSWASRSGVGNSAMSLEGVFDTDLLGLTSRRSVPSSNWSSPLQPHVQYGSNEMMIDGCLGEPVPTPRGVVPRHAAANIYPLTPCAEQPLDFSCGQSVEMSLADDHPHFRTEQSEIVRSSPRVVGADEASGPSVYACKLDHGVKSPAVLRPRSTGRSVSAQRRLHGTPREYVVEVLSPERAREITAEVQSDEGGAGLSLLVESSGKPPPSPALLLCPGVASDGDESDRLSLDGDGDAIGFARCSSSVSISSDEGAIRDRLQQGLQLWRERADARNRVDSACNENTSKTQPRGIDGSERSTRPDVTGHQGDRGNGEFDRRPASTATPRIPGGPGSPSTPVVVRGRRTASHSPPPPMLKSQAFSSPAVAATTASAAMSSSLRGGVRDIPRHQVATSSSPSSFARSAARTGIDKSPRPQFSRPRSQRQEQPRAQQQQQQPYHQNQQDTTQYVSSARTTSQSPAQSFSPRAPRQRQGMGFGPQTLESACQATLASGIPQRSVPSYTPFPTSPSSASAHSPTPHTTARRPMVEHATTGMAATAIGGGYGCGSYTPTNVVGTTAVAVTSATSTYSGAVSSNAFASPNRTQPVTPTQRRQYAPVLSRRSLVMTAGFAGLSFEAEGSGAGSHNVVGGIGGTSCASTGACACASADIFVDGDGAGARSSPVVARALQVGTRRASPV